METIKNKINSNFFYVPCSLYKFFFIVIFSISIKINANNGKHLFILSGQSNMAGLNAETSFLPHLEREFGVGNVIVVKEAQGAQPISMWYKDWKSPNGEIPNPDTRGTIYDQLMNKVSLAIANEQISTITFLWMQGERDARLGYGAVYEASLLGVMNQLKTDLNRQDIHLIIGRLNDFGLSNPQYPDWNSIRQIQVNFTNTYPKSNWIHTDDLNDGLNGTTQYVNDIHMTTTGYTIFGLRCANAAINLIRLEETIESKIRDSEGNIYNTKKIGNLVWMTENLKSTKFANGNPISMVPTAANTQWGSTITPAYSIFRGNLDNFWKYGLLYNFYTLEDERGICPSGWRIPNEDDWQALETIAGVSQASLNRLNIWGGTSEKAGGKLKSTKEGIWASPNLDATDEFGFNWVAGSQRFAYGEFADANTFNTSGFLWSSAIDGNNAIRRQVSASRSDIHRNSISKGVGACVRCVINAETLSIQDQNSESNLLNLEQNFPNPFHHTTKIKFSLQTQSQVLLIVYDIHGREIAVLANSEYTAGNYSVNFDANNLSPGIYIYRIKSNGFDVIKKMILLK